MARSRRKQTGPLKSSAGRDPGQIGGLSSDVASRIGLHLQRTAGLEVRSDDFAERQGEMRRASESRDLTQVLLDHHVRTDRLRVTLWPEWVLQGMVILVGTDFCSIAAAPNGIRHDVPLDHLVSIESLGSSGETRPRPAPEDITTFRTRLRHLQALETQVVVHFDAGPTRSGVIDIVAPDHLGIDGLVVGLGHIVSVVTPDRPSPWGGRA